MLKNNGLRNELLIDFWKSKLRNEPQNILEPFTATGTKSESGIACNLQLPQSIDDNIEKLSNHQPILKYAYYSAALSLLLHRYADVDAIHLAGPSLHQDLQKAGDNSNVNFYNFKFDKNVTFKELFTVAKHEILNIVKYQSVGFYDLKAYLSDKGLLKWLDIYFVYDDLDSSIDLEDNFKLLLRLEKENGAWQLNLSSNQIFFDKEILKNFLSNYLHLLNQLIENPYQPITQYSIISQNEYDLLFSKFNNTHCPFAIKESIIQMLERQAKEKPNKIAVYCKEQSLTYQELNVYANKVARLYIQNDVNAGDIVAVIMDRSIDMIICLLAIWKCGGTYLALDPVLPKSRIRKIISMSNAKLVVTSSENISINKEFDERITFLTISDQEYLREGINEANLNIPTDENDGAYLIYTSGSTGEPKGVLVEHIGMINHMLAFIDELEMDENTILAQNASPSFDISVWQFFTTILTGGATAIIPQDLITNTAQFIADVQDKKVTVLEVVPSYLFLILDQVEVNQQINFDHLKYLMVTGESIKPPLVNHWLDKFPKIPIINAYGPTEASDDITLYVIDKPTSLDTIPIGHVLQNLHIYIVDDRGQLCPIGVKGQIVVSGIGIARGYLNDVEKTKNAFSIDPYRSEKGVRMYKTGDVGRYLPNGNIQFFGRKDYQVKIQGYRIELEEIETTFSAIEGIKNVVVKDWIGKNDGKYLCAYITWSGKEIFTNDQLKEKLSKLLPVYMVPAIIISMKALPLLNNGKINRKELHEPTHYLENSITPHKGEASEPQKTIAEIWAEVLGVPKIGMHDDFFRLGGHSLLVIKAIARMEKAFETKLDAADLFFNPTIESYSKILIQGNEQAYSAIKPLEECDYYDLSHAQRRLWILDQMGAETAYNISNSFQLEGNLSVKKLKKSFSQLINNHEILRTTIIEVDGIPKQKVHSSQFMAFKIQMADLTNKVDAKVEIANVREQESKFKFDLNTGPLLRVKLMQISEQQYILVLTMHHIISDGISMDNIISELTGYYANFAIENNANNLSVQYRDFATWQNKQLKGEQAEKQLAALKATFQGKVPTLQLPTQSVRPPIKTYNGNSKVHKFDKAIYQQLERLTEKNNVTMFMVLIAWVKLLLFRYSGQSDIIVGSSIMGRDQEVLEKQIGLFLNSVAIRSRFNKSDNFLSLLKKVKDSTLAAYSHKSYPFDKLIDELMLERDLSRSPLFDVMVDLQESTSINIEDNHLLDELLVTELPTSVKTSRFDLQFSFLKGEKELVLGVNYNTDLFTDKAIDLLFDHLNVLVNAISKEPQLAIADLEMLSDEELQNHTKPISTKRYTNTVEEIFEQQVARFPERIALECKAKSYAYAELNQLANQLAQHLKSELQVKENEVVAILMDRSEWMFVSLLGILKSGAAFLPIDLKNPTDRINFILNDAEVKTLISDSASMFTVPSAFDGNIFAIDIQLDEVKSAIPDPKNRSNMDRLAYVIYTSGTSGKPKGVCINHSNIVNYLTWANNYYFSNRPNFPFAVFTSFSFDLTLTSMLTTLLRGDTAFIFEEKDINLLLRDVFSTKTEANTVKMTPSHVDLLHYLNLEATNINTIILGGEQLLKRHLDTLLTLNPDMAIYNEYGPTETTIGCMVKKVNVSKNISIGKPIANTEIYILSENLRIQPAGVRGQIAIAGHGLSEGYLNRPELTKNKFIDNPFIKGAKLYLTGDIGYVTHDHEFKYVGRNDQQVKVLGNRIEKEEIENVLKEIHQLDQAVVLQVEINPQEYQLLAYYTSKKPIKDDEIRQYLSRFLPAYMHPSAFIYVTDFPLTLNGKIDHKALMEISQPTSKDKYVPPNSELEKSLVIIWQNVLGKEKVGIRDNFFYLGGNSLKGIQLLSRLELTYEIGLKDLFQHPTIEKFAKEIEVSDWINQDEVLSGVNDTNAKKIVI